MNYLPLNIPSYLKLSQLVLGIALFNNLLFPNITHASDIEFNTEVLDLEDKQNIDLRQFSSIGYIMPNTYNLTLKVNNQQLREIDITYLEEDISKSSNPCVTREIVGLFGLKASLNNKLTWWHDEQCLDTESLPGILIQGDLATSTLNVNIPQAYLEYSSIDWDPPSLWDDGIPAFILDYNLNLNKTHFNNLNNSSSNFNVNTSGVTGINLGKWRLRADWQSTNNDEYSQFTWDRFYAYRALAGIKAKLAIGENYLSSNIFDGFRYIGATLQSDLSMIPPNLRGYAPEITGIAKTNATVVIKQQGQVIYETQVASGPFRIQDLNDSINGKLEVNVNEQDGTVQTFEVDTANLPYLTRPGQLQYKVTVGKPSNIDHHTDGELFFSSEFSWGVSNGWSLISGTLNSQNYNALSIGFGRDLLFFGAFSFDYVQSFLKLQNEKSLKGGSYRFNYSKRFEGYNSQIQFAGYKFSDEDYTSMSDYLNIKNSSGYTRSSKELYTISLSKNFPNLNMSMYLNYNHQNYWNNSSNSYYNFMMSKYISVGSLKNMSMNLTFNFNEYNGNKDNSAYFSISIPLGNSSNFGYSLNNTQYDTNHRLSYYDRLNDNTNYQINAGYNNSGSNAGIFVSHTGNSARFTANASHMNNQYTAFGASVTGGLTLTHKGADAHKVGNMGGSRLLVDTEGVSNISVIGSGSSVKSNLFGKAVIPDVTNYYRNSIKIDLNKLPVDVDVYRSVTQATLTEGSVAYRKFEIISGKKAMATIVLNNGSHPPLGAQVKNDKEQNIGIVGDAGSTYISGINPGKKAIVAWGKNTSCEIKFPSNIEYLTDGSSLPCDFIKSTDEH